jgi:osmotically-inducible protein OsmY
MTEELLEQVRLRLDGAGFPGLRRVQVSMGHGVIVLSGRLDTFYETQMATELTRRVAGVHGVENRIEVESNRSKSGFARRAASG